MRRSATLRAPARLRFPDAVHRLQEGKVQDRPHADAALAAIGISAATAIASSLRRGRRIIAR